MKKIKDLPKYSITQIKKLPLRKFIKLLKSKTLVVTKYGKPQVVCIPTKEWDGLNTFINKLIEGKR